MKYKIEELISESEIKNKVKEMADEITKQYEGENLLIIGLLRGSAIFLSDISREIDSNKVDATIDFMSVSSYGNAMVSSRDVKILKDIEEEVDNRHILIVEDIVDTGRTLNEVKKYYH